MIEFLTILFIVIGVAAFVFPLILCIVYVPESNKSTTIIIYLLIGSILMLGYIDKASRIIAREQAIMDQKKAEEQYQFEKSAAPTVNPARIGKDIEETVKLVKELFSRFKDSKEVSKELETISKNLESKKPLDTKEITFLRNKAIEKGLVVRPSYVRRTLKFPDTVGDETRQLFGDVVRRGGKTTLIDSAAEAYRRGDLEVINGVVEPDAFGGFTVKWELGSGGDITFRDKRTGAYFENDTRKIIQPTQAPAPSAGAAPAKELPKTEDAAVDFNDPTTWKRDPNNPNGRINPRVEKYKDLLALRDRAAKARTAAQDVTGKGRIDLSAEDLNLLRENYKNPEIKSAVDDIIKYHKETYLNSDLQAYLDGNRTVFRNPSDGKVVFDNTWSPEEIADWIKAHPEDAPKGYVSPENNIAEKTQIDDTSFSKPPVETASEPPAAKTEVPEPVAPKGPGPGATELPGVRPTGPETPPPEATPWYEDINSLSPAAQEVVSKSAVKHPENGETSRFMRFLVCKAKTQEALIDIQKLVNERPNDPFLQADIFNLARQRADYLKNGQNSVFDDGYWYKIYKKFGLYKQDYAAQGAIAGTNSKDPKKFELLNGESDPFWLDAEQYCKKHGITNDAPTETASTQKPLDTYIDAADEGLLETVEAIKQVPTEYKYELQERLAKTRDWIEYIEAEPEGAVRKTIQELRENGGFEQLPKRVQQVANEKFPEATQAEINNIPDRGKLEENLATQSPLPKAEDVNPSINANAKEKLQSEFLSRPGNAEQEVQPAAKSEPVAESAAPKDPVPEATELPGTTTKKPTESLPKQKFDPTKFTDGNQQNRMVRIMMPRRSSQLGINYRRCKINIIKIWQTWKQIMKILLVNKRLVLDKKGIRCRLSYWPL